MQHKPMHWAGLVCLIGGLLFWGINLIQTQSPLLIFDILGVLLLLCLTGGPLGLHNLSAFGQGKMSRLGNLGVVITLLGLLVYLVGIFANRINPDLGILYALGALLSGLGMLLVGIAASAAGQLAGWHRFAPLLVGLYYFVMLPIQIIFFISPTGEPSTTLLAFWGLTWVLLGYAIWQEARQPIAVTAQAAMAAGE